MKLMLHKHPDMSAAARVGEPTLVDPPEASAPAILKKNSEELVAAMNGKPLPSEARPAKKAADAQTSAPDAGSQPESAPAGIGELQPLTGAAPSAGSNQVEVKPGGNAAPGANQPPPSNEPPPAPPQVNEAAAGQSSSTDAKAAEKPAEKKASEKDSSSKTKKKKGLKKLIPF
jgi:outer membrane protein assembly factor BamD